MTRRLKELSRILMIDEECWGKLRTAKSSDIFNNWRCLDNKEDKMDVNKDETALLLLSIYRMISIAERKKRV